MAVASLYMAVVELLAELDLAVQLVVVVVHVLQEVRSQGRREWMRKIGVDHNNIVLPNLETVEGIPASDPLALLVPEGSRWPDNGPSIFCT